MLILRFNKGDKGYFEITVISLNGLLDYHDLLQVDRPHVLQVDRPHVFGIGMTILTQCKMGLFRTVHEW